MTYWRFLTSCALFGAAMILAGCVDQPAGSTQVARPEPIPLATPAVTMEADPPPPFTYWALDGSTIRNHPREPAIWIAETADGARKFYFGDQCRASERQGWIGQPVETLPEPPEGSVWRIGCSTCEQTSDLRRDRLNVAFDDDTHVIVEVSCG